MNQAFDSLFEFHESAVICDRYNFASHSAADGIPFFDILPRIRCKLLQAERNSTLALIKIKNLDFDFLAKMGNFGRMIYTSRGHVGDMQQAIHPAKIDEYAKIGNILISSLDLARLNLL